MRSLLALALTLVAALLASGCKLHLESVIRNPSGSMASYGEIVLGRHGQREVLARLGPPDVVEYQLDTFRFDYESVRHRSSRLDLFVPSDIIPGVNPLAVLAIPRVFFDASSEPEEFELDLAERAARSSVSAALRLVPFTSGEEILIVKGHQLRSDRLRVVFHRESKLATAKSIMLATGEYAEQSIGNRVFLTD